MKENKFSYITANGKRSGYFNIYQAKNGKLYLQMANSVTELSIEQIQDLRIDVYTLIEFDYDDFEKAYPKAIYTIPFE